ncbi:MAG: flagellar hook-basal body complex protein FliE [Desulfobacteraceae bacterium]|nr:flagellar hook-basal body complex protein FliE [Desulfobacteraceae bacterium]
MVIKGIQSGYGISQAFPAGGAKEAKPASVAEGTGKFLGELVNKVNNLQLQADKEIQKISTGESQGLHEVMLAMEKSGVAFQFLTQVRNKALDAYQEIMRMQV